MRKLSDLRGGTLYLDTNIFIYALETMLFTDVLKQLFHMIAHGKVEAMTSRLTLAECLVKPLADGNRFLQQIYEDTLQKSPHLLLHPVNHAVLMAAARIRATSGLKLLDAIHAASAIQSGCTAFITNDVQFHTVTGLAVVLVSELEAVPASSVGALPKP